MVVSNSMVGIGTDSPDHTLSVAGDIDLTGGLSFDGGTAVTSIDTDLSSVSGSDDTLASAKAIGAQLDTKSPTTGHSSIATVGTITTGVWQGTAIANAYVADLPTSKITSGTFADGRISSSSVVQHQTSITAVGTLASGTWEATDIAVAHGGTGASSAGDARTNLGVAIGSDVQAHDADLDTLSGCQSGAAGALALLTQTEVEILDGATVNTNELNLLDGDTSVSASVTIADTDGLIVNDGGTMKLIAASDLKTYAGGGGGSAADDSNLILHMQVFA